MLLTKATPLNVSKLLKLAYQMRQRTPPDLMPEDVPLEPLPR